MDKILLAGAIGLMLMGGAHATRYDADAFTCVEAGSQPVIEAGWLGREDGALRLHLARPICTKGVPAQGRGHPAAAGKLHIPILTLMAEPSIYPVRPEAIDALVGHHVLVSGVVVPAQNWTKPGTGLVVRGIRDEPDFGHARVDAPTLFIAVLGAPPPELPDADGRFALGQPGPGLEDVRPKPDCTVVGEARDGSKLVYDFKALTGEAREHVTGDTSHFLLSGRDALCTIGMDGSRSCEDRMDVEWLWGFRQAQWAALQAATKACAGADLHLTESY